MDIRFENELVIIDQFASAELHTFVLSKAICMHQLDVTFGLHQWSPESVRSDIDLC